MSDTANTYGISHQFGLLGTAAFLTLQSDDISFKKALDVEVTDEFGKVITNRLDDTRAEVSLSGVLKTGANTPIVGEHFTYNNIQYIIKEITDNGTNNGYRKVGMKLVKYQEIA
jgi:hypothetical protein